MNIPKNPSPRFKARVELEIRRRHNRDDRLIDAWRELAASKTALIEKNREIQRFALILKALTQESITFRQWLIAGVRSGEISERAALELEAMRPKHLFKEFDDFDSSE